MLFKTTGVAIKKPVRGTKKAFRLPYIDMKRKSH